MGRRLGRWVCAGIAVGGLILVCLSFLPPSGNPGRETLWPLGSSLAGLGLIFLWALALTGSRPRTQRQLIVGATASADIAKPRSELWRFVYSPDTAVLIAPGVLRSFRVPGTPTGVGEQHGVVHQGPQGEVICRILEVTSFEPESVAEVRGVTSPPSWTRYELADIPGGTRLTYRTKVHYPRFRLYLVHPKVLARQGAEAYVASVKRVIESGIAWEPERAPQPIPPSPWSPTA